MIFIISDINVCSVDSVWIIKTSLIVHLNIWLDNENKLKVID